MELRDKNSLPWGAQIARGNMRLTHIHHQFGRNTADGAVSVDMEVIMLEAET